MANAQTDVSGRIGENGYLIELKQEVYKGIYLGGQFRDFGEVSDEKRTGVALVGINFVKTDVVNFYLDGGYGYHNQYLYGVSMDIRFTRGFYLSAAFDNLNWVTAGVKIRLSDLKKGRQCNCNYKR